MAKVAVNKTSENCGQFHIRGQDISKRFGYPIAYEFNKPETLLAKFEPIPAQTLGRCTRTRRTPTGTASSTWTGRRASMPRRG